MLKKLSFLSAFKNISGLALPMALSYTFSFAIVAIGIMSTYLSHNALHMADTTLIMTVANTSIIIALSPLFAMGIVASHLLGNLRHAQENGESKAHKDHIKQKVALVNQCGMLISTAISPVIFLFLFFSKWVLVHVFGQSADVSAIAQSFLRIYAFAAPTILFRISFEQIMFSFAKAKSAMKMGLVSFSVGTVLAVFFAFGGFGFAGLGLPGIAVGYLIDAVLIMLFFALYIARGREFGDYHFFKLSGFSNSTKELLKEVLKIGAPISFNIMNEMLLTFVLAVIAGLVSTLALASLSLVMQFVFFLFIALSAFGQACCQEVSRQIGAKQYCNAKQLSYYGLVTTLMVIAPLCIVVALDPNLLSIILGNHNRAVSETLIFLMPIIALTVVLDAVRYNILQVLRALSDHIWPTAVSSIALLLGMGIAAVLGILTNLGVYGIGLGYLAGVSLGTISLFFRWLLRVKMVPSQ